jgi:hypothetical protein
LESSVVLSSGANTGPDLANSGLFLEKTSSYGTIVSYVDRVRKLRPDWPIVEIQGANHINRILKLQFREAIAAWENRSAK